MFLQAKSALRALVGGRQSTLFRVERPNFDTPFAALIPRGHRHLGDPSRLLRAMCKAARGETVSLGIIGGSITQGGNASDISHRYADRVAAWWRTTFPASQLFYVNAGIGGTGTNYGAHRLGYQVLHHNPDIVLIEFAVNDDDTRHYGETLEGMVRQSLMHPSRPAVFILSPMKNDGSNAQTFHDPVALHYNLTTLSVRDMLWPEIAAGRMQWSDVTADHIHPNDHGHRALADLVISWLDNVAATLVTAAVSDSDPAVPAPLYSDTYAVTSIHLAEPIMSAPQLTPLRNDGWRIGETSWCEPCLEADRPGAILEAEVRGTEIHLLHHKQSGDFGMVRVQVDDRPPELLDGWYAGGGDGIKMCYPIARGLSAGVHRVRIEVVEQRAADSNACRFQLLGVLAAGAR